MVTSSDFFGSGLDGIVLLLLGSPRVRSLVSTYAYRTRKANTDLWIGANLGGVGGAGGGESRVEVGKGSIGGRGWTPASVVHAAIEKGGCLMRHGRLI